MIPLTALLFVAVVSVSPCFFFDALLNHPKRKRLLDEYAEKGIDVRGVAIHQKITKSYGRITDVLIKYAYRAPQTNEIVVKGYVQFPGPVNRFIGVKVLPDHAKSGYPRVLVGEREEEYGGGRVNCKTVSLAACVLLGAFLIGFFLQCLVGDDESTGASTCSFHPWVVYPLTFFVFAALGYPTTGCSYRSWEKEMLEGCEKTSIARSRSGGYALLAGSDPECPVLPLELFPTEEESHEETPDAETSACSKEAETEHSKEGEKSMFDMMAMEIV